MGVVCGCYSGVVRIVSDIAPAVVEGIPVPVSLASSDTESISSVSLIYAGSETGTDFGATEPLSPFLMAALCSQFF